MQWRRVAVLAAVLLGSVTLGAAPARAATKDVSIHDIKFDPATISVKEGDSIKWTNNETPATGPSHTVKSDQIASLNSGAQPLTPGSAYTFQFGPATAGTYSYYCSIHGSASMSGTIIVEPAATTSSTAKPTTTTRPTATTARATTTTRKATTTTTVADETTTSETIGSLDTSIPEDTTTSSTEGNLAIRQSGGGGNGAAIAVLVVAIAAVLGAGGYALYRLRSGRF